MLLSSAFHYFKLTSTLKESWRSRTAPIQLSPWQGVDRLVGSGCVRTDVVDTSQVRSYNSYGVTFKRNSTVAPILSYIEQGEKGGKQCVRKRHFDVENPSLRRRPGYM